MIAEGAVVVMLLTAFCPCREICTKGNGLPVGHRPLTRAGTTPVQGHAVACDPRVLPLGSIVEIEGLGERQCHDTGGAIRGLHLDVFFDQHAEARRFGRQRRRVRVLHVGGSHARSAPTSVARKANGTRASRP